MKKNLSAVFGLFFLLIFNAVASVLEPGQFDATLEKAESGNAEAQHLIGLCYSNGENVPKDSAKALIWIRKAAENGYAKSQLLLYNMYKLGVGAQVDEVESIKWLRMGAEQGDSNSQCSLGLAYLLGDMIPRDGVEGVKWTRKAAEQGNADAQYVLGGLYQDGDRVPKNNAEAVKWYSLAAEQGQSNAQSALAVCYTTGVGVPLDNTQAVKWFRITAEKGDAKGQFMLGQSYKDGLLGLEVDLVTAYFWCNLAASGNDEKIKENATAVRAELSSRMSKDMITKAQELSRDWKPRENPTVEVSQLQESTTLPTPAATAVVESEASIPSEGHSLKSLEGVSLPVTLAVEEAVILLGGTGKEVSIEPGKKILVTKRSSGGTLTMIIDGKPFVGNEMRLSEKVKIDGK